VQAAPARRRHDEDALIDIYLAAAVAHLDGEDGWLGRAIVAQTWSQTSTRSSARSCSAWRR
jgi:hypothetical protein